MSISVEGEEEIVRWAYAEIINYFKQKYPPYWFRYQFKRWKVHKIMYQAFEAANIPVTRSWYRYGCFIHSTQLAGFEDFSPLKHRYLRSEFPPERLRYHVKNMGFDVDYTIQKIHEIIDDMPQKMDIYLKTLYEDAPNGLSNIYIAKLDLFNDLNQIKTYRSETSFPFHVWLSKIRKDISVFHMAAFSSSQFIDLADIVTSFTSNIEESLQKIDELMLHDKKIFKKWINLIQGFPQFYDEQVWHPFALEISAITVKGWRADQERIKQLEKKKEKLGQSINEINLLAKNLIENNLILSWDEYQERLNRSDLDREVITSISEMEGIYEKSTGT